MKKKLSEIIDEQIKKTDAILGFVSKKTKNDVAEIQLLMALNSLRVAKYAIEKQEDGEPKTEMLDLESRFIQVKQFFWQLESYKKKVDDK